MNIFRHPPEPHVFRLLRECRLPVEDLAPGKLDHFLGCGKTDAPEGIAGLEIFGTIGLLRSLAVAAGARKHGCGKALVTGIEDMALEHGVTALYLITNTAEAFFEQAGYIRIGRDDAPEAIRETEEFSGLCPSTATVMVKILTVEKDGS
jgi:amino-acid N-acetyltransferase